MQKLLRTHSFPQGMDGKTYFGPPHSTAEAFTNRMGCNPTGSMLRVLFSTASRTAEANLKQKATKRIKFWQKKKKIKIRFSAISQTWP